MSQKLFKAALKVRKNSHSPYSSYKVASAILMDDGKIYAGVNVENASYGATICAERSAILSAIVEHKTLSTADIKMIANTKYNMSTITAPVISGK
jgi:cytidine deaminase